MRLIKLFAYSLLGYVLYELYLGMTEGAQASAAPQRARKSSGRQRRSVNVQNADGAQSSQTVGRGVVH